jgi:hypothetical protein
MAGRLCPGEGSLPLEQMLVYIEANSPGLDVCMEVFSAPLKEMGWAAAGRRLAASGRAVLAGAGVEFAQDAV